MTLYYFYSGWNLCDRLYFTLDIQLLDSPAWKPIL
jgi:hypothetical protein